MAHDHPAIARGHQDYPATGELDRRICSEQAI
jgi:DNA topoisomerase IB